MSSGNLDEEYKMNSLSACPQETLIKSSFASVQIGAVRSDGKLWLTSTALHFDAFNRQFGFGPYEIALSAISQVEKCWGKGAGMMPMTCDGIEITHKDGRVFQFIVANPDEWLGLLGQ
jgi:hypothetical protein